MEEYHYNWIEKHNKTEDWLRNASANGFDIHHIDGDYTNSNPENLILIYCGDHAQLHDAPLKAFTHRASNGWLTGKRSRPRKREKKKSKKEKNISKTFKYQLGKQVWFLRQAGDKWENISEILNQSVEVCRSSFHYFDKLNP